MFLLYPIVNILVILGLDYLIKESFEVDSVTSAFWFVAILTVLNFLVVPVIKLLTFPINFVTLGIFNTLLNLSVIAFVSNVVDGVSINGNRLESLLVIVLIAASLSLAHSLIGNAIEKE
jgi:putative membrane protein